MAMGTELRREVLSELQALKSIPFKPHADMDYVWSLSAPGTVRDQAPHGTVFEGEKPDLLVVTHAIEVVRAITAVRMGVEPCEVTKTDIRIDGPRLYYNGEDEETEDVNYPQNQHLEEWVDDENCPLPQENLVIGKLEKISTPFQVKGIVEDLRTAKYSGQVATVAMAPHSCRVGRYIEHQVETIPEDVRFVVAPAQVTTNVLAKIISEMAKIETYAAKGDLSETNYFFREH